MVGLLPNGNLLDNVGAVQPRAEHAPTWPTNCNIGGRVFWLTFQVDRPLSQIDTHLNSCSPKF